MEPVDLFSTNAIREEWNFENPIYTPWRLRGAHLGILTPDFRSFGSNMKTGHPQVWQFAKISLVLW